jgi:hypothetical protein
VVIHICYLITLEAEAGKSQVWGQPGFPSDTL